jgi:5-methylthioadenosine/S-adenosylhomocysteine deaminase
MDADLAIDGGIVLTMVQGRPPIRNARILIKGGEITHILPKGGGDASQNVREVIEADDCIVMPGLINAHTHAAMTLFRGFADDLPLRTWLFEKIFPLEASFLDPETVYWGSALACLEMIASGTTTFVDGYFFQDATMRAAHGSGMRGLIAQGVIDFPAPGVQNPKNNMEVARAFLEKWAGFSDLVRPGLFCHSPVTCSSDTLRRGWELSREFHTPLQIHLSETREEVEEIIGRTGKRPVHYLDDLGLIGPDLIAAHGVHLDRTEMLRILEGGVKVVHVPESNMKLSSGVAPVFELLRLGVPLGLGTDGCASNNNLDLFREMDTASKLGKVFGLDPVRLKAEEVLRMATSSGAALLGLEKEIGTLEVGKRADVIVVDLKNPHLCPLYDPFSALVYSAGGSDVRDVVVNGKILMKKKEFMTLDLTEILEKVKEIGRRIASG